MPIPIALKEFLRVILFLEAQKVDKLWITGFHLLARRPAVVRQVISSAEFDCPVYDSAELFTDGSLAQARNVSLSFSMKRMVPYVMST